MKPVSKPAKPVKQPRQSIWIRVGIGMASVAMIGYVFSQIVTPGSAVPLIPPVSTPAAPSGDVTLVPIPAEQVGKSGGQTIPTQTIPTIKVSLERERATTL